MRTKFLTSVAALAVSISIFAVSTSPTAAEDCFRDTDDDGLADGTAGANSNGNDQALA